jgi:hypothetical protein
MLYVGHILVLLARDEGGMSLDQEIVSEVPAEAAIPGKRKFQSFFVDRTAAGIEVRVSSMLVPDSGDPALWRENAYTLAQLEIRPYGGRMPTRLHSLSLRWMASWLVRMTLLCPLFWIICDERPH